MLVRDQQFALEVRRVDTSALQYWNIPLIVDHFIVKFSLMIFFLGVINTIHPVVMEKIH